MIPDIVWIVVLYVAAAAFAHWILRRGSGKERRHYVLVAGNHQMEIEGYVRALRQYSRRTGTDIGITVLLDRSTDDTGHILERMARRHEGIEWARMEELRTDSGMPGSGKAAHNDYGAGAETSGGKMQVVRVNLADLEDVRRLPL
mgnify:CR=1 FL=1